MSMTEHGRPTLDPASLAELRACDEDGDGGLLAELVDIFLEDTPRRMLLLRHAFDAGDTAAISREAHALKGSCGQFGAWALEDCCRELEQLGRQGSLAGAEELLLRMDDEYPRVKAALSVERMH